MDSKSSSPSSSHLQAVATEDCPTIGFLMGSSGAIAGVLSAYILMFPQSRVNVLLGRQIVAMPAVIVLGMWIVLQLVSGVDETANVGGVAYMAHIGGFAAGFLMAFLLRGTRPPSTAV
jgi:rhomboid family protein